jgi:hypothetical protein
MTGPPAIPGQPGPARDGLRRSRGGAVKQERQAPAGAA